MPLIRSKARSLKIRDPISGVMLDVVPGEWTQILALPSSLVPDGDGEVEVRREYDEPQVEQQHRRGRRRRG